MIKIRSFDYDNIPLRIRHRDTHYIAELITDHSYATSDMMCFCVKLERDLKWWIIAWSYEDDDNFDDLGPFDTPEDALVFMKLSCEIRS